MLKLQCREITDVYPQVGPVEQLGIMKAPHDTEGLSLFCVILVLLLANVLIAQL
jgi:hypothetical protein